MATTISAENMDMLIGYAVKYGLEAAIAIAKAIKSNNIDDAIAALEAAHAKSAQAYLDEAKAKATTTVSSTTVS
jgi:hypothetical protein